MNPLSGAAGVANVGAEPSANLITADQCITWSNGVAFPLDCDPSTWRDGSDGEVLACGRLEPSEVTVQGGNLYWGEADGIIATVPLNGAGGHILQCSDGTVWHLASDAQNLYWSQQSAFTSATGTTGIFSLPRNGGKRTQIASAPEPVSLLLHGEQLLWADYSTNQLAALDLDTRLIGLLAENQAGVISLAVTESAAYWAESQAGQVMKLSLQPGAVPVSLAAGQVQPGAMAVNSSGIFWVTGGGMTSGDVLRMVDAPGAVPQVVAGSESAPGSLVADDDALYWTVDSYNWRQDGAIRKLSLTAGSLPTTLAAGQGEPGQPVIAGDYLYWADLGPSGQLGGTIRRIAR